MTSPSAGGWAQPIEDRVVRVFVSSTFRDTQAERNALVTHVFPQLRRRCEERGVTWGDVDLRWGITDEEAAEGKILEICLAEVRQCRPFFLAILADRYGWIPPEIPADLRNAEPWLRDHAGKSVTELEILCGALLELTDPVHAYFYLRKSAAVGEAPTDGEGDQEAAAKLDDLKRRIVASGRPVRHYTEPSAIAPLVLDDFSALIEQLFPSGREVSPREREHLAHAAFARARGRFYLGRQTYFDRLDDVLHDGAPLMVLGAPGAGKSALLAAWTRRPAAPGDTVTLAPRSFGERVGRLARGIVRRARASPPAGVIVHFVGATAAGADTPSMLRRLIALLDDELAHAPPVPEDDALLAHAFSARLAAVGAVRRTVLVIDGVDQLDAQGAQLEWLPLPVPGGVQVILSGTPNPALERLRLRGWRVLDVAPLMAEERQAFVVEHLLRYGRRLSEGAMRTLIAAPQSSTPLYLRALLDELRTFGRHEDLPERLAYYLGATSVRELYAKVLNRLETSYEADRPRLVADSLGLLWAARDGLTESELLDVLGPRGAPLPAAVWSPLYLALGESVVTRGGRLTFAHPDLREAVQARHLSSDADRRATRRHLVDYFTSRPLGPRTVEELPWQLVALEAWAELEAVLADPGFLAFAWRLDPYGVKTWWARLEREVPQCLVRAYHPVIAAPECHPEIVSAVAVLLEDTGHGQEALGLVTFLEASCRARGDRDGLQAALARRAALLKARGALEQAMVLLAEQETICRAQGPPQALAACLGNQGVCLRAEGRLDLAAARHVEEERLCREIGDTRGLIASLLNQAVIQFETGDLAGALARITEQEAICRHVGDLSSLYKGLGNQAVFRAARGELEQALALHAEEERLCRRLGDRVALQACLGNQALVYERLGDYDGALARLEERERLCRELRDDVRLARTLLQQAYLLGGTLKQTRPATRIAEDALRVAQAAGAAALVNEARRLVAALEDGSSPSRR